MAKTREGGVAGLGSAASTRTVENGDLDRVAACVRGWETRLTQLAPGPGRASISESVLASSRLVRLRVDTPVALEALPLGPRPDELFHVGAISLAGNRLLWQGLAVRPDMLMLEEGEVPSSFALPAGCELLVARLGRERIESLVHLLRGAEDQRAKRRPQLRAQPASALEELRSLLRTLVRAELHDDGALIAAAEADLYERVASMLAARPLPSRPSPRTRRRALRRAEEYMHAHARERILLSDLCAAAECSERTLRQVFRECYGTGPMAFLKRLRLQNLRQDLRDAAPGSTTVRDRALRWGFWHMGHLALDYKSFFGETPSETLSREFEIALDEEPPKTRKAGETFYEPSGVVHRVARNPSAKTNTRVLGSDASSSRRERGHDPGRGMSDP